MKQNLNHQMMQNQSVQHSHKHNQVTKLGIRSKGNAYGYKHFVRFTIQDSLMHTVLSYARDSMNTIFTAWPFFVGDELQSLSRFQFRNTL